MESQKTKQKTKPHQTHRKRDQACSYQRWRVRGGRNGGKVVKGTNFQLQDKYKAYNVQQDD